ncbi:hypothetical protein EZ456_20815 [Pedobacter psychrodurus]|uniref:Uncharacterized protein n=1 Tax=Pedobacter psychrodurus TaxID=2530456 RepID=A0A4R0PHS4_9SPHI|nr:hypothetical protein [Pedobacter psychrodurus]TCD18941.1 hypothetical protein EZ456_20815 [Pedobacter psychrodurus]
MNNSEKELPEGSILTLFRGDSIYNTKTKPGSYRSEGLTSSAFGAGSDPQNIEKKTLLRTIKEHIDHKKKLEKVYFRISDYLAFSESKSRAMEWASGMQPELLQPCTEAYTETRYLFEMKIPHPLLREISTGIYEFRFSCNTTLKRANSPGETAFVLNNLFQMQICRICESKHPYHSLILICPRMLLQELSDNPDFVRAYELTSKDLEWLVLPNDPINFGLRGTRIQPADFWQADWFTIAGEPARDPMVFSYEKSSD